ncbi:uncharacterized protein METZ01_LOCUS363058, partial [marine metagenome]
KPRNAGACGKKDRSVVDCRGCPRPRRRAVAHGGCEFRQRGKHVDAVQHSQRGAGPARSFPGSEAGRALLLPGARTEPRAGGAALAERVDPSAATGGGRLSPQSRHEGVDRRTGLSVSRGERVLHGGSPQAVWVHLSGSGGQV